MSVKEVILSTYGFSGAPKQFASERESSFCLKLIRERSLAAAQLKLRFLLRHRRRLIRRQPRTGDIILINCKHVC